jgi:hypothetical protein
VARTSCDRHALEARLRHAAAGQGSDDRDIADSAWSVSALALIPRIILRIIYEWRKPLKALLGVVLMEFGHEARAPVPKIGEGPGPGPASEAEEPARWVLSVSPSPTRSPCRPQPARNPRIHGRTRCNTHFGVHDRGMLRPHHDRIEV